MNYFAHGVDFIDRPYFLAGTACPDWLSVADRRVRLREEGVRPLLHGKGETASELAAGILQHLRDDRAFHKTRAFYEVTAELTGLIRAALGPEDGFRPGFLGHIATEMLIDAVLIEENPCRLERYYETLDRLDPMVIQRAVNRMARRQTDRLAPFIPLFCRERFLRDYRDGDGLLYRLNQVMRRVGLRRLEAELLPALNEGRKLVRRRIDELLAIRRSS